MSIEIQNLPGGLVQNTPDAGQAAAPPTRSESDTAVSGAPRGDTFSLTQTASHLQGLEHAIGSLPVVDTQRVEGVQRQLATGSFQEDPARTAGKMLEMERYLA